MMPASVQYAMTTLTIPPSTASSTDSVRTCVMSCRRVAPSESRTAISVVRFAARASSRLAMLAQAMSSTMPVTAKSSVSGSRDAVIAELWPLRPSLSVMTCGAESCRGLGAHAFDPRRLDVVDDRVIRGVDRRGAPAPSWRPARGGRR